MPPGPQFALDTVAAGSIGKPAVDIQADGSGSTVIGLVASPSAALLDEHAD